MHRVPHCFVPIDSPVSPLHTRVACRLESREGTAPARWQRLLSTAKQPIGYTKACSCRNCLLLCFDVAYTQYCRLEGSVGWWGERRRRRLAEQTLHSAPKRFPPVAKLYNIKVYEPLALSLTIGLHFTARRRRNYYRRPCPNAVECARYSLH